MGFGASKMNKGSTKEENINSSAGVNPSGSEQGSEKQVPPNSSKITTTKEHVNKNTSDAVSANQSTENPGNKETGTSISVKSENQSGGVKDSTEEGDSTKEKTVDNKNVADERLIQEEPKEQQGFDLALKFTCMLLKPESLLKAVTQNVTKLHLRRALPLHFSLHNLLLKFENLKDLDISYNNLGPQAFRAVCLAMCNNSTILSLNLAGNKTDTDSAESLGKMLTDNQTLQYLDVSSNYLGKDYFSRQVGGALKVNKTLKVLKCESVGITDIRVFAECLQANTTLTELDFSRNDISDKLGLAKGLAESLKNPSCSLCCVALSRCGINSAGMAEIQKGLCVNQSLTELNLNGSEFASLGSLVSFIVAGAKHPQLTNLSLDGCTVKSQDVKTDSTSCDKVSSLQCLSLNNCSVSDAFFEELTKCTQGKLFSLTEVDISANDGLSPACLDQLVKITSDEERPSSLRKLKYGLNKGDGITSKLEAFASLLYINVRLCHISTAEVGLLVRLLGNPCSSLTTLILDGLKLSGTSAIKELLETAKNGHLSTLSLGSCSLDDNDLPPLCDPIKAGLQLHMLKLSANRITDVGVSALVEAVLKNKNHPLSVLDLSNNRMEDNGAKSLVKLLSGKSKLHSLNVSSNNIGKEGLLTLVSAVGGKSPLRTLYVQGQNIKLAEPQMVEICSKLATSLGFKIQRDGESIKPGCCDLPSSQLEGVVVNLRYLGGHAGDVGQAMDSPGIMTDYALDVLPNLTFSHTMEICGYLKGIGEGPCVWSDQEWSMITGADKATTDTPSWLKMSSQRELALYLNNLQGHTTQQKIEAILEMEADCNLDEVCLMKDPVTRSINGTGWAVMVDQESVQKAVDYFNTGEAKVFGQSFMMSRLNVAVDDVANAEAEKKAQEDRLLRQKQRQAEDAAHRTLITNTAEETWKRHAYRLAHPAYADGRIW